MSVILGGQAASLFVNADEWPQSKTGYSQAGAAVEADSRNDFLLPYGIRMTAPCTGMNGNIDTSVATDPIYAGVSQLCIDNPNGHGLTGNVVCRDQQRRLAAWARYDTPAVPLPAGGALMLTALAGSIGARRLRR